MDRTNSQFISRLGRSYRGELEAISEYLYNSIMTEPYDKDESQLFEQVSEDEMRHFRLIGEMIRDLGGNPVIRTCIGVPPLSPEGLRQTEGRLPDSLYDRLLRDETDARAEYLALADIAPTAEAAETLRRIASDEERHAALWRREA